MLKRVKYLALSMVPIIKSEIPMLCRIKITGIKTGMDKILKTVFCPAPCRAIAAIKLNAAPIPIAPKKINPRKVP